MLKRTVITVDGLAGSGKTTLARRLAEKLNFRHLNSGLFYRGAAQLTLDGKLDPADEAAIVAMLKLHKLQLSINRQGEVTLLIDGIDCGEKVRAPQISERTSKISVLKGVRDYLVEPQRGCFDDDPLVAEGRDMGTIIFEKAPLKFFIEADQDVRIERRLQQLYGDFQKLPEHKRNLLKREIEIEVIERDKRDSERSIAPTLPADGAIIIDNSRQRLTEVVQKMYDLAVSRGLGPRR